MLRRPRWVARATKNRSRATPFVKFSPPQLVGHRNTAHFLIWVAKTLSAPSPAGLAEASPPSPICVVRVSERPKIRAPGRVHNADQASYTAGTSGRGISPAFSQNSRGGMKNAQLRGIVKVYTFQNLDLSPNPRVFHQHSPCR
jgi:hypothetical protein